MPTPRIRFVWDPEVNDLVEVSNTTSSGETLPYIQTDITPFKSPIDGTVIESRSQLRRHMAKHKVIPLDELKGMKRPDRSAEYKKERIRALSDAFEHNRNLARSRS